MRQDQFEAVAWLRRWRGEQGLEEIIVDGIDFSTKRLLGNFPQGYSHIALIDTALTLSESPEWLGETEHFQP